VVQYSLRLTEYNHVLENVSSGCAEAGEGRSEHVRLRRMYDYTGDMKGAQLSVVGPLNTRAECTNYHLAVVCYRNQRV
jgi:hypothetical protein